MHGCTGPAKPWLAPRVGYGGSERLSEHTFKQLRSEGLVRISILLGIQVHPWPMTANRPGAVARGRRFSLPSRSEPSRTRPSARGGSARTLWLSVHQLLDRRALERHVPVHPLELLNAWTMIGPSEQRFPETSEDIPSFHRTGRDRPCASLWAVRLSFSLRC